MYYYGMTGYSLVIIATIITIIAEIYVKTRYIKYKDVDTVSALSGFEVARKILDENGLNDIHIVEVKGNLTDHYDPTNRVVRLSTDVFHGCTIASNSVAAHECGHAIQHKEGYFFIKLRGMLIPIVNFSSKAGYITILIGLLFGMIQLAWAGVFLLIFILLFQLITLPTELDASKRALAILEKDSILNKEELMGSKSMLRAAAFTYVASLATTLLQILRLALIVIENDRDR